MRNSLIALFLLWTVVASVVFGAALATRCRSYDLPAPPPRPPLASIAVSQVQWKNCKAVEAVLEPGTLLCDAVNCDVLHGFAPGMSPDQARARHGPASGEWTQLGYCNYGYYYDVPAGRVTLCLESDSGSGHWVTRGYPNRSDCESVVLNASVLTQLQEIKSTDDEIYFTLVSDHTPRGELSLHVKASKCESVALYGPEHWMDEVVERAAEQGVAPVEALN